MQAQAPQDDTPPPLEEWEFPQGATKTKPKKKPNGDAPPDELPLPEGQSAFALVEKDLPEPLRLCDPWAMEGLNIIAGRPKLGKTTLERQKLAAAATGSQFLDSEFKKPCLCAFLCLEEGELLTRLKFKNAGFSEQALTNIQIHLTWPRGPDGVDQLNRYLDANPDIQMVVIDSLTRFRSLPDPKHPPFMADYEAVSRLQECSKAHPGVCIDVIHHTRKGRSEDPIDDISGTYGLTAACDSYVVLRHHADGVSMFIGGRLWAREENQYLLKKSGGGWEMIGVDLGLPDEQIQTLNMIKVNKHGISGAEVGEKLGISTQAGWQRIEILIEKGFVVKRHGRAYVKGSVT